MARVTNEYLKDLINIHLKESERSFTANEVYATRHTRDQYESGACKHIVNFTDTESNSKCYFFAVIYEDKEDIKFLLKAGKKVKLEKDHPSGLAIRFR